MSHLLQVPKQVFESCVMGCVICSNKVFLGFTWLALFLRWLLGSSSSNKAST